MDIRERTKELSNQLLEVYDETKKCIKCAKTHKEHLYVHNLLNALTLFHGNL